MGHIIVRILVQAGQVLALGQVAGAAKFIVAISPVIRDLWLMWIRNPEKREKLVTQIRCAITKAQETGDTSDIEQLIRRG